MPDVHHPNNGAAVFVFALPDSAKGDMCMRFLTTVAAAR